MNPVHIRKVKLKNYKSIAECSVELGAVNILVGRNGAGKSNFLDALRFVKEALEHSLDYAIKTRGGVDNVRRKSTGHPHNFKVQLEVSLPDDDVAQYGFEIGMRKPKGVFVKNETLVVYGADWKKKAYYVVSDGCLSDKSSDVMPPVSKDRLYLTNAAGLPEFRAAYEALQEIGLYNLNPSSIRDLADPDLGSLLTLDGGNIASVVERMQADCPDILERVSTYLKTIVPDIVGVRRVALGPKETIEFKQFVEGAQHPWTFHAENMSDGTLRALGCLVAISQVSRDDVPVKMVGIEEPETALHPSAAGGLLEAIRECAEKTQVLITTHSSDLLDHVELEQDHLFVVQSRQGTTQVGPVDPASADSIREHLFSAGDLLRLDQLSVDPGQLEMQADFSF